MSNIAAASALRQAQGLAKKIIPGASDPDSKLKTKKESKASKKKALTTVPGDIIIKESMRLNEGAYKPNKVEPAPSTSADYYRRGRVRPNESGTPAGVEYEYNPRFIQDPDQEEIASIRLIGKPNDKSKSEPIDLIPPFSKFFLEAYQESHMERSQVVETFGDFYAFFFGERPPIYNFSGTLLNTKDINWKEDFMFYYEKFLRGTKCVEMKARIVLTYGLSQIEGFLLNVNMQANAANEKGVGVSWQVLVVDRKQMRLSLDFGITEANGVFNIDNSIIEALQRGKSDPSTSNSYKHAEKALKGEENPSKTTPTKASEPDKVEAIAPSIPVEPRNDGLTLGPSWFDVNEPIPGLGEERPFPRIG
jgi:hypothetical protein